MTDLLVLLSHGHSGRPDVPRGVGAAHDGRCELDLIRDYAQACEQALRGHGVACWPVADGTLVERQRRAVDYGKAWLEDHPKGLVLYVACHVNASPESARSPGDYGAVFHDARSSLGATIAGHVKASLERLPELKRGIQRETPGQSWGGAHATIRGIYSGPARMAAICYEPFFLDQPKHWPLMTQGGLREIGAALARGLIETARAQGLGGEG